MADRGWLATVVGHMPRDLMRSAHAAGAGVVPLPGGLAIDAEPGYLEACGALDRVDLVIVDHYDIGAAWHRTVSAGRRAIAAIDDGASSPLAVDLVLNQNLGASPGQYATLVPTGTIVLAGPRYALVRPEFAAARAGMAERTGRVNRVLVFLSGADEDDVTSRAVAAVVAAGKRVDVVVGTAYPFLEGLRARTASMPDVQLHVNTTAMPQLMASADLAIGAPGSASWERCTLALPGILVVLADNQLDVARRLVAAGAAIVLGWHHEVTNDQLTAAVVDLSSNPGRVREMSRAAGQISDGRGAIRVADALESLVATWTPAQPPTGAA
jgi:UDP-2,4-diacetamido-2,4,6-trideoxy-beta-L-altropyranose hydrolase